MLHSATTGTIAGVALVHTIPGAYSQVLPSCSWPSTRTIMLRALHALGKPCRVLCFVGFTLHAL
jgi:hypothetical protein